MYYTTYVDPTTYYTIVCMYVGGFASMWWKLGEKMVIRILPPRYDLYWSGINRVLQSNHAPFPVVDKTNPYFRDLLKTYQVQVWYFQKILPLMAEIVL